MYSAKVRQHGAESYLIIVCQNSGVHTRHVMATGSMQKTSFLNVSLTNQFHCVRRSASRFLSPSIFLNFAISAPTSF